MDASVEAKRNAAADASLHALYWSGAQLISGGQGEQAVQARYTLQHGALKGKSVMVLHIGHKMDPTYPSKNFNIGRLVID